VKIRVINTIIFLFRIQGASRNRHWSGERYTQSWASLYLQATFK
jgi:hypothetical protein